MKIYLPHETLIHKIQQFAESAREYRQVFRRLEQLLPDRLLTLEREKRKLGLTASESQRAALVSPEYLDLVDELSEVGFQSFSSRIQYETHVMLVDARRSLRYFKR